MHQGRWSLLVSGEAGCREGEAVCLCCRYVTLFPVTYSLFLFVSRSTPNSLLTEVPDYRKKQSRLLTFWPTIPIEVAPMAVPTVLLALRGLGSTNPKLRTTLLEKSGPLKTDQDFFIIDAPFAPLLTAKDVKSGKGKGDGSDGTWEVNRLSEAIKNLTGVLEVGIFSGLNGIEAEAFRANKKADEPRPVIPGGQKPVAVYFGMEDGSVEVRKAEQL